MLIFQEEGKPENPEKNTRREVGGWWEASALTTAPPPLFFLYGSPHRVSDPAVPDKSLTRERDFLCFSGSSIILFIKKIFILLLDWSAGSYASVGGPVYQ